MHSARDLGGSSLSATPTICVVDDDPSLRKALVGLILSMGFEACGFASAEAALESGAAAASDCVLTDIHMPGLDGFGLKRKLDEMGATTPVIMMTGRDEAHLERRVEQVGAMCLLRKPLHAYTLAKYLDRVLGSG